MEGFFFFTQANQIQMSTMSQEPSQSESSAAAPALSTGCDATANSGQTFSVCESLRKNIGNGTSSHASEAKGLIFYICFCGFWSLLFFFSLAFFFSFFKFENTVWHSIYFCILPTSTKLMIFLTNTTSICSFKCSQVTMDPFLTISKIQNS